MNIMKTVQIYCDNYYTEVTTFEALHAKNTYATGTLRKTKAFLPKPILATTTREVVIDRAHNNICKSFAAKYIF